MLLVLLLLAAVVVFLAVDSLFVAVMIFVGAIVGFCIYIGVVFVVVAAFVDAAVIIIIVAVVVVCKRAIMNDTR